MSATKKTGHWAVLLGWAMICLMSLGPPSGCRTARGATRKNLASIGIALEQFHRDVGRYPTMQEGLEALVEKPEGGDSGRWKGPYLKGRIPPDAWGSPYVYLYPGTVNPGGFDLFSCGSDRKEGGKGSAEDIYYTPSTR